MPPKPESHQGLRGLFVGLVTLDLLYLVEQMPASNEKGVAIDYTLAAGGPATNAAVTFHHLGHHPTLLAALGTHALSQVVRSDLHQWQVDLVDLLPLSPHPVPTSSIFVTQSTGDRAVMSLNAVRTQAQPQDVPAAIWERLDQRDVDVVLLDGHQMEVGVAIARRAHQYGIPTVLDGGSWKPGLEKLLPWISHAICSSHFHPPQTNPATPTGVFALLHDAEIPHRAITWGSQPVLFEQGLGSDRHSGSIPVPSVQTIDTCGAGDVFHGAFCAAVLRASFPEALREAAAIAARSCQSFGTRQWMQS